MLEEFSQIRQELHQKAELKYEEKNTSDFIKNKLLEYGYEVNHIAGTGLYCMLDSGIEGKTVALRAEMDALPIVEQTNLSYTSLNENTMHACGHDGHMATLLMVAKYLKQNSESFKGKIKFIFQPAEEGGGGAAKMIAEGILENPKVDAIFGYHNYSLRLGVVGIKKGCILASNDRFVIKIEGKDGHAAMPQNTINPIIIAADVIGKMQKLLAQANPIEPKVLNITGIHAGKTFNVVPKECSLIGTLRTCSAKARIEIINAMKKICLGAEVETNAIINFDIGKDFYPATINSGKETRLVNKSAQKLFAESEIVKLTDPVMASEDFSFYLEKIPGCFFFVGNGETSILHTDTYNFNESIIPIAASLLTQAAFDFLNEA